MQQSYPRHPKHIFGLGSQRRMPIGSFLANKEIGN